jgi:uncharacterized protein
MTRYFPSKTRFALFLGGIIALGLVVSTATSMALQRPPEYQAARTAGVIGEKPDGYLGFVVTPSADVKAMVDDLNIKRKAAYTVRAQNEGVTVQLIGQRAGCKQIKDTAIGEKYMGPDNVWRTRTAEAPMRDPSCV